MRALKLGNEGIWDMSNIAQSQSEKTAIVISVEDTDYMRDAGGKSVTWLTVLSRYGVDQLVSRDSDLTKMLQTLFYEGALRDGCGVTLDEAKWLLTLSSSKHKTAKAGEKRSEDQDRVYSLAKYNWSVACDNVGLAKIAIGGNRGAAAPAARDAPITVESFHVPHGLDTKGALSEFVKFADAMRRVLSENAATIKGDVGEKLRTAYGELNDNLNDAVKLIEVDKLVLTAEEAMEAKIIAKLAAQGAFKAKFKLAA